MSEKDKTYLARWSSFRVRRRRDRAFAALHALSFKDI